ncbi:hypothetical protein KZZ52_38805 [Dactylosporangium sp. AC04546]|uniref:hypothetical protein n=1 Tax=Dactylosporangium sp. AC04546 TaxID=2862460 RepID=UPI001EDF9665|nr:hypothetical protein [Dactylosporangium sp. AC04546]WVK79904.1 hypothetical protein KZZ52_38805 [Dactylosporangium sp. AC04546]
MEILPGVGVAEVKLGESRADVERRIGAPVHKRRSSKEVYDTEPQLVVHYLPGDTVELVEIGYSGGGEEVFFDGVQLTYRFLDDVAADLAAKGHRAHPIDIGYRFEAGFAVWSMASRHAQDLDPDADDEDERLVSEGVSVAPFDYFGEQDDEED